MLSVVSKEMRMSTLQIADLTGKRHSNIVRDLKSHFLNENIALLNFEQSYFDANNVKRM